MKGKKADSQKVAHSDDQPRNTIPSYFKGSAGRIGETREKVWSREIGGWFSFNLGLEICELMESGA